MSPKIFFFGHCLRPFKSSSKKGSLVLDSSGLDLLGTSESKLDVKSSTLQKELSQLHDELKNEKEEKFQVLKELSESKKKIDSQRDTSQNNSNIEALEQELQRANQSEREALESLISQTRLLEEAKMNLEESKLEINSLKENNKNLMTSRTSGGSSSRKNFGKFLLHTGLPSILNGEEDKISGKSFRLPIKQGENSNNALDETAIALEEELDRIRSEAEFPKSLLKGAQDKLKVALQENENLKLEIDESIASWSHKETALVECIKMSEEEINKAKAENDKLIESQKLIRKENAKLREMLKCLVGEASIIKENLESSRKENSQLKHLLSEKEDKLQCIKQEYESLKVSEAAATYSFKELKSLLAATTAI